MVNVTDGADIDVRLCPLELRLCHWVLLEPALSGRPTTPVWPFCFLLLHQLIGQPVGLQKLEAIRL